MWRFFAAAALLSVGCSDGRLVMQLDLPSDPTLDPTLECSNSGCGPNLRLARYSLRVTPTRGGAPRNQETVASTAGELSIGSVPVDTSFDVRLAGQSGTGQVLGVGRVREVSVGARGETVISLKFRKPIAYVGGGPTLRIFDVAGARDLERPSLGLGNVVDVAASPNGVISAALTKNNLIRLRTGDHSALGCTQPLGICQQPTLVSKANTAACIAISPDSSSALICDGQAMVAVLNLLGDTPAATGFQVGGNGATNAVAFEPDASPTAAWVLVNGVGTTCNNVQSRLVRVLVDSSGNRCNGQPACADSRSAINIGAAAADVAVDPLDSRILWVVTPCRQETVVALRDGQPIGKPLTVGTVPPAYDVAVTDSKIVFIGEAPRRTDAQGALLPLEGQAVIIERTDASRPPLPDPKEVAALTRTFEVPTISVRFQASSSDQGFLFWSLDAQSFKVFNFEVSPDGQRAALLTETRYTSDISLGSCQYSADVTANGVMIVDINGGTVLLDALTKLDFTKCSSNCISGANTQAGCEAFFRDGLRSRGRLSQTPYRPSGSAMLFGGS